MRKRGRSDCVLGPLVNSCFLTVTVTVVLRTRAVTLARVQSTPRHGAVKPWVTRPATVLLVTIIVATTELRTGTSAS